MGHRRLAPVVALALLLTACSSAHSTRQVRPRPTPSASPTRSASARPVAAPPPPNPTVRENARPGTRHWQLRHPSSHHEIEGYADRVSVRTGQPVRLFVSTAAPSFRVRAFRMGWYGGILARQVWAGPRVPGLLQRAAVVSAGTNTVRAPWRPSLTVPTADWPPGDYLLRLDAASGWQTFVPLTVRGPLPPHAVVVMNAVTTWQAYNTWGGYSLYQGADGTFAHRARVVSFDRPYSFGEGTADFLGNELPLLATAERIGIALGYGTDVDLHADPAFLRGASALVSLGHDEYWSAAMRARATAARDRGVNIAFLGANAVYRHIRLASGPLGPYRTEVCYKVAAEDPLDGRDDADVTVDWRDPPVDRPESVLTGTFYQCNPVRADLVVADPSAWLFRGAGVRRGTRLHGLLGSEFDVVDLSAPTPRPIQVLFHSPVACRGRAQFSDAAYYSTRSGAGVFDSGTSSWVCALLDGCAEHRGDRVAEHVVSVVTINLLRAFAAGPAGRAHPAVDNAAHLA